MVSPSYIISNNCITSTVTELATLKVVKFLLCQYVVPIVWAPENAVKYVDNKFIEFIPLNCLPII